MAPKRTPVPGELTPELKWLKKQMDRHKGPSGGWKGWLERNTSPRRLVPLAFLLHTLVRNGEFVAGSWTYCVTAIFKERAMRVAAKLYDSPPPHVRETFCRSVTLPQADGAEAAALNGVHVAWGCNANNSAGLLSSMISVSRNLHDPGNCTFHVIANSEDYERVQDVVDCFRGEVADLPRIPEVRVYRSKDREWGASINWTSAFIADGSPLRTAEALEKLYLHEHLPKVPRIIWLEPEVIVKSDIAPLYQMHMEHVVAAAWTPSGLEAGVAAYKKCLDLHPEISEGDREWSINTGMMVVDLARWRAENWAAEVERWCLRWSGCLGDQLAFAHALKGAYDQLPWSWHVHGLGSLRKLLGQMRCYKHADILHWSGEGGSKPWTKTRNTIADYLVEPYTPRNRCEALGDNISRIYKGKDLPAAPRDET